MASIDWKSVSGCKRIGTSRLKKKVLGRGGMGDCDTYYDGSSNSSLGSHEATTLYSTPHDFDREFASNFDVNDGGISSPGRCD